MDLKSQNAEAYRFFAALRMTTVNAKWNYETTFYFAGII